MLDLGDTLVHETTVFPHVQEALAVFQSFETAPGQPLELCLVSDFLMPTSPVTAAKIETIFKQYCALLDQLKLSEFFMPLARRVTLSTQAGVRKPDRRIFDLAIKRLGLSASLSECLFITESREHIDACRKMGMATLQFGTAGSAGVEFSDWSEAPLLVNQMIAPQNLDNLERGLKLHLAVGHGMELVSMSKAKSERKIRGRVQKWHPVPNARSGGAVQVPIPAEFEAEFEDKGRIRSVTAQPDSEAVEDAESFLQTLEDNQQVTEESGALPPGVTHRIEKDKKGHKRLVRKRFSAI